MFDLQIFTDGGCRPNGHPRAVGACAIVVVNAQGQVVETLCHGHVEHVTNNAMELEALKLALAYAVQHQHQQFTIKTDSKYVLQGLSEWIAKWKVNGWKTAAGEPVKNQRLWQQVHFLHSAATNVILTWVKGHTGHQFNNRADQLCTREINRLYAQHHG